MRTHFVLVCDEILTLLIILLMWAAYNVSASLTHTLTHTHTHTHLFSRYLPDGGKTMAHVPGSTKMADLLSYVCEKRGLQASGMQLAADPKGKRPLSTMGSVNQNAVHEV